MQKKGRRKKLILYTVITVVLLLAVAFVLSRVLPGSAGLEITVLRQTEAVDAAEAETGKTAETGMFAQAETMSKGEPAAQETETVPQGEATGQGQEAEATSQGEPTEQETEAASGETAAAQTETGLQEVSAVQEEDSQVEEYLEQLTLEEKIAQMFIITPEALTGVSTVTAAGETTKSALWQYPVGGLVYFTQNITSEAQLTEMLWAVQQYSEERIGLPLFLCVDEEGGTVTRISGQGVIDVPDIEAMEIIGQGTFEDAFDTGATIGSYLSDLLFNVDFAPVADVATNPDNSVIGSRSFGSDPETVAGMVAAFVEGIQGQGVSATLKHFPGHGDTSEDSHVSRSSSYKTLDELRECEFLPFISGIEAGCAFVMVGHISLPNVTGDDTPATLSYQLLTEILREELGFEGIVVTDAMNMAAITDYYTSGEAAVAAVKAGVDMILMPADFQGAYEGLLSAVGAGDISEDRINESLRRILAVKLQETISGFF